MNELDKDVLVRGVALSRMAIGFVIVAAPGFAARTWTGADAKQSGVRMLARGLGARDALIGLGTFLSAGQENELRRWLQIGAASDTVDALITLLNYGRLPHPHRVIIAGAASGAAVGSVLIARADSRES